MKSVRFLAATALASASFFAMPSTAFAQDAAAPAEAEDAGAAIIVTGSRIRRPNLESTVPVTSVTGEELFETGTLSVGDQLNDLPQLRSTYSQQNSTRFLGTRGLNLLDLRGLGTARTLVLVNGRRHVASDILVNGVSPDVNTFPTQLIERIDIVTGGASSIYGSDAIAGVVNFVLKQDYDGAEVRGQSGISRYGDAGNQYLAVLAGKNFADGRGNIAINLEYAHTDRYYGSNRPNLRQNDGFVTVDTDVATDPFNADSTSTISLGGQLGLAQARANPACGTDALGSPFTCGYLFQPDGSIIAQTGTRVGLSPNGNYVGGNGYSGREGQLLTLTPQLDRYAINLIGHFEISPAFVPFIEAKYVRSEAFGSVSGPFFTQGATLADSLNRERVRLDNPYLSPAVRTQLTTAIPTLPRRPRPPSPLPSAPRLPTARFACRCAATGSISASATKSSGARRTASSLASVANSTMTGPTSSRPTMVTTRSATSSRATSTVSATCSRSILFSIRPPIRSSAARKSIRLRSAPIVQAMLLSWQPMLPRAFR
jgi:outer membrane receptor protein involved in Fe transport